MSYEASFITVNADATTICLTHGYDSKHDEANQVKHFCSFYNK